MSNNLGFKYRIYPNKTQQELIQNNEHWFLKPTKFTFISRVNIYNILSKQVVSPTTSVKIKIPKQTVSLRAENVTQQFMSKVLAGLK